MQRSEDRLNGIVGQEVAAGHVDFHEMAAVLSKGQDGCIGEESTLVELDLFPWWEGMQFKEEKERTKQRVSACPGVICNYGLRALPIGPALAVCCWIALCPSPSIYPIYPSNPCAPSALCSSPRRLG